MPSPALPLVDYAAAVPPWRRRWRRALVASGLLALAAAALWWGPAVGRHVNLLRLQARCMSYTQPSGHVAYDHDVSHVVSDWQNLYAAVSPPGMKPAAIVFLHERRNSRGEARLIAVSAGNWSSDYHSGVHLEAKTLRPGTLLTRPALLRESKEPGILLEGTMRVLTGRPDPADPSHFVIECHLAGRSVILDGWLHDDDSVAIEPR